MPTIAKEPFRFVSSSYLVRILPQRAMNLEELLRIVQSVPEASIFHHTFQSLEQHNYTTYSNDFAQWSAAACNQAEIAEQLASVDVRDYVSLDELRKTFVDILSREREKRPDAFSRLAYEPFFFCETEEVTVLLETQAINLSQLVEGIRRMSLHTLHYHFISSHIRPKLGVNDFSCWIEDSLGLPQLAARLHRIDIYTNTLEQIRRQILNMLTPWINL
jgi:uncharacterized protein DUF5752